MSHLLDTNVISELVSAQPSPAVLGQVAGVETPFLSWISIHDIAYAITRLPEGRRRSELEAFLEQTIAQFGARILPVAQPEAMAAARIQALRETQGRPVHLADALIAGTAAAHSLTLMTRNVKDFEGAGVSVLNPWDEGGA